MRSSATAEDLPDASFAGQQESFLNIRGADAVIDAVRRVFASLFTDRAVSYRCYHGYDKTDIALSVAVQRMVHSDLAASGVMFTLDTDRVLKMWCLLPPLMVWGRASCKAALIPMNFMFINRR